MNDDWKNWGVIVDRIRSDGRDSMALSDVLVDRINKASAIDQIKLTQTDTAVTGANSFSGTWGTDKISDQQDINNDVESDLRSHNNRLKAIEDQMLIFDRDTTLESQFDELKEAWEQYSDVLGKLKPFKALKDSA